MINLLPVKDKILIEREYERRLLVIAGTFMFSLFCIAAILLFPSYFLIFSQKQNFEARVAVLEKRLRLEEASGIESSVNDLNDKLSFLASQKDASRRIGSLLEQVLKLKPSDVKLIGFSFENKKDGGSNFFLEGSAGTRNSFLTFKESLKKIEGATGVFSPPSNLLKGENVSFRLTVELVPAEATPR